MKKSLFKVSLLGIASIAIVLTSCEQDQEVTVDQTKSTLELAKEHAEKIGYNPDDIEIRDFYFPNGKTGERIFIEDDIALTEEQFFGLEQIQTLEKQYRTFNLVTGTNRTIDILGYTANNANGLSSKAQTGLTWAVANYNRLSGVSLDLRLTFGTNFEAADMVVYDTSSSNSSSGGVAGFPSNSGVPNKFVQIYNLEGFSTNVNEHVITHEIGHSIGFRHSDYFSRQSCGQSGEAAGTAGAVYIPGTATGWDPSSLMNACFSGSTSGEFNNNDVIALQNMY
ncbi:peptidase M10 [Nonlabens sp. MB-3u-79]|uniref:M57 family metalloprotease n=1 Tax=Nonlabens sp. MB-3u-79 TaxID=2058134 RepID=UPI000C31908E|nr:M57 family metalloprotease [Nonlabens sp. MB-3u-79]AUC79428.1 peptidase M10 [Nonlabens sp. MB-3u-79]